MWNFDSGTLIDEKIINLGMNWQTDRLDRQGIEAVPQRCSVKKVFLRFSQKNICARVSFLKKRLWRRCFPVNFANFLRTLFLTERLWWLLLKATPTPVFNTIIRSRLRKKQLLVKQRVS